MAVAMTQGRLSGDVTPVHLRNSSQPLPLVQPGRRSMQAFRKTPAAVPSFTHPGPCASSAAPAGAIARKGSVTSFTGQHMTNCLRFAANQSNQRKVGACAELALRIFP